LFLCASRSAAQVGIRTEDPQGMLHVDAKGDTYTNPADTLDDVVVTRQGRIGVGTLHPQTRLDVVNSTPGAIRIADGTQGGGKILTSDDAGKAHWASTAGSWYAALTGGWVTGANSGTAAQLWPPFAYTGAELSPPEAGSVNVADGIITVPYTGTYRVSITGKAFTNLPTNFSFILSYLYLIVNNTEQSYPHVHSLKDFGWMDFGFMFFYVLNAGDELRMMPVRDANQMTNSYCANQYSDSILQIEFVK
jgi:hypothetical protein